MDFEKQTRNRLFDDYLIEALNMVECNQFGIGAFIDWMGSS